ncbi:MAG: ribonuclease P protein component [Candidatus Paceibacterales bacterium]
MLPVKNRLNKKKDFENIFRKGKSFRGDFLVLKIAKNNLNQVRFGFIVSQKVSKKATIRNKVKRRLRELVRSKIKTLKKGIDAILITVPGIETKEFREIEEIMDKLFKKAGVVNP